MSDAEPESPRCFRCGKHPDEFEEYRIGFFNHTLTPDAYVRQFESTYNPATNHYACSPCFLAIGLGLDALKKWIAP